MAIKNVLKTLKTSGKCEDMGEDVKQRVMLAMCALILTS